MAERTAWAQQREYEADQRLRRQRDDAEARIKALQERLRQTQSMLVERDDAIRAAHEQGAARANAAEQRAAQRIAQTEHDAWARITELQEQLGVEHGGTNSRTSFRERWRRS